MGGVKGNYRPYLSQPFTGSDHPSITHKAVTYLDVALPIWSQQSKNYVVLALLSTTRIEYGEKTDMADIIGWFGEMGSGSVSAAYEWMAWWEAGPAGKSYGQSDEEGDLGNKPQRSGYTEKRGHQVV